VPLAALVIAWGVATPPARAQQTPVVEGTVLMLDGGDVVVDVGKARGVVDGDVVELWRPVKVKHPVTGKLLVDRFKIGELKISQARDVLSLARPVGNLLRPVETGDVVTIPGKAPVAVVTPTPLPKPTSTGTSPVTTTTTKPTPLASAKPGTPSPAGSGSITVLPPPAPSAVEWGNEPCKEEDAEAKELSILFDDLTGATPETRASRYEAWAKAHPKSRYARVVLEEAAALRMPSAPPPEHADTIELLSHAAPSELVRGDAASIAVELIGPVSGVVFYGALDDETAFQPIPMKGAGARYWTVTLPASRVSGKRLRWFVQGVLPNGKGIFVLADPSAPHETKIVEPMKAETPTPHEATAALWLDYADYNRLRGNDRALQVEGFFGLRLGDTGLRAVRSGLGIYRGEGGAVDELDAVSNAKSPRAVGLTYGFLEAEWGLTHFWGLITRAVIGLGESGLDGGGQVFVRIGNDKSTNILLGGEFLGGIGLRGIAQVELNMFPRFPILVRTEVTNQPAGVTPSASELASQSKNGVLPAAGQADLGIRAIAQVGFRQTKNLSWFVRLSGQGRTINHFGPGAGMGVSLSW
jgi:hypothetical protein